MVLPLSDFVACRKRCYNQSGCQYPSFGTLFEDKIKRIPDTNNTNNTSDTKIIRKNYLHCHLFIY